MATTGKYSIKDLEALSRIKSHTIRIWEKRYGLLEPERTDTNIRYYTNEDLKKILNVSFLNQHGLKISKIAEMSDDQIRQKVLQTHNTSSNVSDIIENLIVAMIELDEARFVQLFNNCVLRFGFEQSVLNVLFPFFQKIGIMWQTGVINPAQEHFVSNIVRQKIIAATDSLPVIINPNKPKVLLLLPESELHEISLLFYNYALKSREYATVYLGQAVPLESLTRIADITKPQVIISVITNSTGNLVLQSIIQKFETVKNVKFLLSGASVIKHTEKLPKRIESFRDLNHLFELIEKI